MSALKALIILSGSQTGGSDPSAKEQITGKTSQAGIQNEIWT